VWYKCRIGKILKIHEFTVETKIMQQMVPDSKVHNVNQFKINQMDKKDE